MRISDWSSDVCSSDLSLKMVTATSAVAVATGERLVHLDEFDQLIGQRAAHIVQPDLCHVGGLSLGRKIAAMAEAASIGLAPHNPLGPIAGTVALHFGIATSNLIIQEEMVGAVPWYDEVVQTPIRRSEEQTSELQSLMRTSYAV